MPPQNIQQLYMELDELKKKFNSLSSSSTIDRNVETALRERLGDIKVIGTNSLTITINGKVCTVAFT